MGQAKQRQIEEEGQGFSFSNKYVCDACFEDEAIQAFIVRVANQGTCDYCGRSENRNIAAPLDEVMKLILDSLRTEWETPDDAGMMYISREGGYQGKVYDTYDLFDHIGSPAENQTVLDEVIELILNEQWCKRYYFTGTREDALTNSWDHLVHIIKHQTRYLFLSVRQPEVEFGGYTIDPADLLDEMAIELKSLKLERNLKPGDHLYRCRIHKQQETLSTAEQLGPPRSCKALSSRMSPAGISLMYVASKSATAFNEIFNPKKEHSDEVATIADFELLRDIRILDLTQLPNIPSLYDAENRHKRDGIKFLHAFMADITKTVAKDGSEHLDYFPTQVVSEYIRHVYKDSDGKGVEGIAYLSAADQTGKNYALFLKQDDCSDDSSQAEGKALFLRKDLLQRRPVPTG